jgi:hypothetical protein
MIKMSTQKIDHAPWNHHNPKAKVHIFEGCTRFFIGQVRRFGLKLTFFSFPLNMEEHPNL